MTTTERFLARIDKSDPEGCWLWTGPLFRLGYGNTGGPWPEVEVLAHRYAYRLFVGPIPDGLSILHSCDNRRCVQPGHLRVGTQADNIQDMFDRGRNLTGEAHGRCVLTDEQVREIRASSLFQRELAKQYGVAQSHIWRIIHRHSRRDVS